MEIPPFFSCFDVSRAFTVTFSQWTPKSARLLRPNFNILINGGALGSDETGHGCNLIPGREMLEATFGRVGQNMSITACAGGHVAGFDEGKGFLLLDLKGLYTGNIFLYFDTTSNFDRQDF